MERRIAKNELEYAYFWKKGTKSKKPFTSLKEGKVDIPYSLRKDIQGSILTHNHPSGGSLSPGDIKVFLSFEPQELRAIDGITGEVFSLRWLKPISKLEADKVVKNVDKIMKSLNPFKRPN
jgi:hypothetical protein